VKITHTEYHLRFFFACQTRAAAAKSGRQFTKTIEDSIRDAIFRGATEKVREHVKAGRLAKGFGVEMNP